jgi:hypothetical protein
VSTPNGPKSRVTPSRAAQKLIAMAIPPSVRALLRTTPTVVRLKNRALISVSGSQAAEFLNGLLSTAVTTQAHGSFYSSFLHAQVRPSGRPTLGVKVDVKNHRAVSFTTSLFMRHRMPSLNLLI